jgi:hypothetical protein
MAHLVIRKFLIRLGRQQGYRDRGMVGKSQLRAESKSHADGFLDYRTYYALVPSSNMEERRGGGS